MHQPSQSLSRRALLKLMGAASAGAALVACTPVGPNAAPAAEGGAAPAVEKTLVRFWNVWGAAREELMNQIVANFEEEHPDITVQNLVQPFEGRAENLFAALASNDPPEVLMATRAEILKFASENSIVSISDMVASEGLDLNVFYPSEIGNFYWEDKLYSMPMPTGGGITCLELVNFDMFKAAGTEPTIPQTWAELEEVAKEFVEIDDRGIVKIGADVGTGSSSFFAWLYCNNGAIYSDDLRSVAFNSEEGLATLEWMVNFTNNINGGVQNVTDFFAGPGEATEAQPWYNDAQAINFPNVSIFFHMQTYKPDMQWDMTTRPYNGSNSDAQSQGLSGEEFAWGYIISGKVPEAKHDAAFQWIKKITYDADGGGWFVQQQGRPSPIKAVNEDQSYYDVNEHWDKVLNALSTDVSVNILPEHARIADLVNQGVQAAMFGDATPADALAQAAEQAQAVVDEFWSNRG
ncbi:MAG: extracellular solute-binding protein [Caldilineaceae bacterium]|nr:extracellular solute-binding protein [Caldilineaceae bacterium]